MRDGKTQRMSTGELDKYDVVNEKQNVVSMAICVLYEECEGIDLCMTIEKRKGER